MQKFLSIDNVAEVQSIVTKDAFSVSRLNTLGIMKFSSSNPLPTLTYYTGASGVLSDYGTGDTYNFSKIYFNFLSKNTTSPEKLGIYVWNSSATPAYLRGSKCSDIETLKTLNGAFSISVNGSTSDISVDLTTDGIVSYDNVASAIQTALQKSFSNATCIYSTITNGFIIGGNQEGASSTISYISSPTSGTDISQSGLGLSDADTGTIIAGKDAVATLEDALNDISSINGNYYVVTPLFTFDTEATDLQTFGSWVDESNDRYLGIYLWDNAKIGTTTGITDNYKNYNGLYIDYKKTNYQNAFSSAIISSLDLSEDGGLFNINFTEADDYTSIAISSQTEFDNMNSNLCNAFYVFGELGQYTTCYGQGQIMGDISSANVYINQSYLRFQMQFAIANLFTNSKYISLRGDSTGSALVKSALTPVFTQAVNVGLIIVDDLTTSEKTTITSNFSDAETAIDSLESNGWAIEVAKIDTTTKTITFNYAYIANLPANKVVVKTYVLGV